MENEHIIYQFDVGSLFCHPKIKKKNGSLIKIGKNRSLTITIDHHFNWFQKKMIKWCFGFDIKDYSEE